MYYYTRARGTPVPPKETNSQIIHKIVISIFEYSKPKNYNKIGCCRSLLVQWSCFMHEQYKICYNEDIILIRLVPDKPKRLLFITFIGCFNFKAVENYLNPNR